MSTALIVDVFLDEHFRVVPAPAGFVFFRMVSRLTPVVLPVDTMDDRTVVESLRVKT
jgi:hypothetical protein